VLPRQNQKYTKVPNVKNNKFCTKSMLIRCASDAFREFKWVGNRWVPKVHDQSSEISQIVDVETFAWKSTKQNKTQFIHRLLNSDFT